MQNNEMLNSLYISNYALIDKLNIDFQAGFSVITGETGAGKSILIGALSLLLGKRADTSVLHDGKNKCIVEGEFSIAQLSLKQFFESHELDYEDQTILRREISPSGKSRAFINDTPVKLIVLKELGSKLVDIHSQHETLNLGKSEFQLEVIDRFGTDKKLLEEYSLKFGFYKEGINKLEELIKQNETSKRDEDYYTFQFNELEAAQLDEDEINSLIEKEKLLSHAEEVNSISGMAREILIDEDFSVTDKISELVEAFSKLSSYHPDFKEIHDRLTSVNIEIKDIAGELDGMIVEGGFDKESLQAIYQRLDTVYSLQQKHSVATVAELIALRNEFSAKLEGISGLEEEIASLKTILTKTENRLQKLAHQITKQRIKSSVQFSDSVNKVIAKLGMPDAGFQVKISKLEELMPSGLDKTEFLFSPNKGGKPGIISKIASGGELSRLMLAIKSMITSKELLPTIIFDEIDSGVSGDIAGKVGNLLKEISENHQLIAITHLPQIAAKANDHYFVFKENNNGKTSSKIVVLSKEERIEEIAKMLSDETISKAARETARELLD